MADGPAHYRVAQIKWDKIPGTLVTRYRILRGNLKVVLECSVNNDGTVGWDPRNEEAGAPRCQRGSRVSNSRVRMGLAAKRVALSAPPWPPAACRLP